MTTGKAPLHGRRGTHKVRLTERGTVVRDVLFAALFWTTVIAIVLLTIDLAQAIFSHLLGVSDVRG